MNLAALGHLVHQRRLALGLSQARLAALSGLSRVTVNQLETGVLIDLGAAKLIALLGLVGVKLDIAQRKGKPNAILSLSRTASVSYKTVLDPRALVDAMIDGELPADITPHVATLLDEAPVPLIVAAVEEVAAQHALPPKLLWKHLIAWAHALQSPRKIWV